MWLSLINFIFIFYANHLINNWDFFESNYYWFYVHIKISTMIWELWSIMISGRYSCLSFYLAAKTINYSHKTIYILSKKLHFNIFIIVSFSSIILVQLFNCLLESGFWSWMPTSKSSAQHSIWGRRSNCRAGELAVYCLFR